MVDVGKPRAYRKRSGGESGACDASEGVEAAEVLKGAESSGSKIIEN